MNLGKIFPGYFAEQDINPMLDVIYKYHAPHTHEKALEEIFTAGISFTLNSLEKNDASAKLAELRRELDALQQRYDALQVRYNGLNEKFNINQLTIDPAHADEMQAKAISQAMGMGKVFQCGDDYQPYE